MVFRPKGGDSSAVKWRLGSKGDLVSGIVDPVFNAPQKCSKVVPTFSMCCIEIGEI